MMCGVGVQYTIRVGCLVLYHMGKIPIVFVFMLVHAYEPP